jgi:hypothetical protein
MHLKIVVLTVAQYSSPTVNNLVVHASTPCALQVSQPGANNFDNGVMVK